MRWQIMQGTTVSGSMMRYVSLFATAYVANIKLADNPLLSELCDMAWHMVEKTYRPRLLRTQIDL